MNLPPMIMWIKISRQNRGINLWLPLFIIIPIAVIFTTALFLILLPLILAATIVLWLLRLRGLWRPLFFFWPAVLGCLFAARGLEVDIRQGQENVSVAIK